MEFRTEFADYKDELAFLRAYLTEHRSWAHSSKNGRTEKSLC